MGVSISRPNSTRLIKWRTSTNSEPVNLEPGAAWNLYLPSTFAGTSIQIQVFVERKIDDKDTDEGPIEGWRDYAGAAGTIAVAAPDEVIDLTPNNLFGLGKVRFVSNQTENCTGELMVSS